jgi:hypothetical protein
MFKTTDAVTFKVIEQNDSDWFMSDGVRLIPRACIQISQNCPANYKLMISDAINKGHLKLQVFVKDKDYMWEKLGG